jgi:hypothetical protein
MKNLQSRLPDKNKDESSVSAASVHSSLKGKPRMSC